MGALNPFDYRHVPVRPGSELLPPALADIVYATMLPMGIWRAFGA